MTEPAKFIITPQAAMQIESQVFARPQSNPLSGIRVGVKGGGCSGLKYIIEYCDQPDKSDTVFSAYRALVYIDPKSLIHLTGTTLDFINTFQQKGFKFINPQQQSECGCGQSFSI